MLSAALAALEGTSDDNNENSRDISEDTRQGLASNFTDSSEGEVTVEPSATGAAGAIGAAGAEGAAEDVGAAGPPPPPQHIWGQEEELTLHRGLVGQADSRPAGRAAPSRG